MNLDPICQRRSPNYVPTEQELSEWNFEFRERLEDYQKRLQIWSEKRKKIEHIMARLDRGVEKMSNFMQQMLKNCDEPELSDLILEALDAEFAELRIIFSKSESYSDYRNFFIENDYQVFLDSLRDKIKEQYEKLLVVWDNLGVPIAERSVVPSCAEENFSLELLDTYTGLVKNLTKIYEENEEIYRLVKEWDDR